MGWSDALTPEVSDDIYGSSGELNRGGQENFPSEPDFHRFLHQAGPQSVKMEIEMNHERSQDGIPFSPRQVSKFSIRLTFSIRKLPGVGRAVSADGPCTHHFSDSHSAAEAIATTTPTRHR